MTCVKLERYNTVANPLPNAPQGTTEGVSAGLGFHKAGSRILLRPRYCEFYINANTCPNGAAPYNLEGPYVRIRPAAMVQAEPGDAFGSKEQSAVLRRNRGGEVYSTSAGNVTIGTTNITYPTTDEFYYEVDAIGASIFLPFDATLDLYTDYSGVWLFDVYMMSPNWNEDVNTARNTVMTQTRQVRHGNDRAVVSPVGAHSVQFTGDSSLILSVNQSDASKTAVGNSDIVVTANGSGLWPGVPSPMANARSFQVNAGASTKDAQAIFAIQIP